MNRERKKHLSQESLRSGPYKEGNDRRSVFLQLHRVGVSHVDVVDISENSFIFSSFYSNLLRSRNEDCHHLWPAHRNGILQSIRQTGPSPSQIV